MKIYEYQKYDSVILRFKKYIMPFPTDSDVSGLALAKRSDTFLLVEKITLLGNKTFQLPLINN